MLLKSLRNVAEGYIIHLKTRNFFDSYMLMIITLSLVGFYFKVPVLLCSQGPS